MFFFQEDDMKTFSKLALVSLLLVSMAAFVACSSAKSKVDFAGSPEWYNNPVKGCGVGSAKLRRIRSLARDSAVASARADLSRALKTTTQGMLKKYMAEGEADEKDFSEELTTSVVRDVTENTLVGTRVAATANVGQELFAMVCLDPETFADAFDRMNRLSQKAREALKARAKAEFDDMDEQLEKLRDRQ